MKKRFQFKRDIFGRVKISPAVRAILKASPKSTVGEVFELLTSYNLNPSWVNVNNAVNEISRERKCMAKAKKIGKARKKFHFKRTADGRIKMLDAVRTILSVSPKTTVDDVCITLARHGCNPLWPAVRSAWDKVARQREGMAKAKEIGKVRKKFQFERTADGRIKIHAAVCTILSVSPKATVDDVCITLARHGCNPSWSSVQTEMYAIARERKCMAKAKKIGKVRREFRFDKTTTGKVMILPAVRTILGALPKATTEDVFMILAMHNLNPLWSSVDAAVDVIRLERKCMAVARQREGMAKAKEIGKVRKKFHFERTADGRTKLLDAVRTILSVSPKATTEDVFVDLASHGHVPIWESVVCALTDVRRQREIKKMLKKGGYNE